MFAAQKVKKMEVVYTEVMEEIPRTRKGLQGTLIVHNHNMYKGTSIFVYVFNIFFSNEQCLMVDGWMGSEIECCSFNQVGKNMYTSKLNLIH